MDLIYGFDPLCGWCYGMVPAMRALREARPDLRVRLCMPGLVTGGRVGPYCEMEGYIRGASERLLAVTGRAPSDAFYDLIARPGVLGQSAPPCLVLDAARDLDEAAAVTLAHLVIDLHFERGADLNDPGTYPALIAQAGLEMDVPDLDPARAEAIWRKDAGVGIRSFPTLILDGTPLPTEYDAERLIAQVDARAPVA